MTDRRSRASFDSALFVAAQGVWADADIRQGHLRLRTLLNVRWMVIAGEILLLTIMSLGLGHRTPLGLVALVIAAAALANLVTARLWSRQRILGDREAALQLSFDVGQIALLMGLIGGSANPFVLALLGPVALAAATLPLRPLLVVSALASASAILLAFVALPYPSIHLVTLDGPYPGNHQSPMLTLEYRLTAALAVVAGIALIAGIVRQSVVEAARMALALDVTRTVLAREQKLSSLGVLAAAAAHELGTPLSTIAIIARELSRAPPTPAVKEDAELLIAETARCREILRRLGDMSERAAEAELEFAPLRQLLQEIVEPFQNVLATVSIDVEITGGPEAGMTLLRRWPEVGHAMAILVENAVDFARSNVRLIAHADDAIIRLEVRDDGPGFAPEILSRLGEPYVTSRPSGERSPTGHVGLGLGFFIAKTLLERSGAVVTYRNSRPTGAVVTVVWDRAPFRRT